MNSYFFQMRSSSLTGNCYTLQAAQFGVVENPDAEHTACHVKRKIFDYSFEVSTFLFFFIPMTLITILYVLIGLRLRRSALLKKSSGSFGNHQEATRKGSCRQQSSSRVLKMLGESVICVYSLKCMGGGKLKEKKINIRW